MPSPNPITPHHHLHRRPRRGRAYTTDEESPVKRACKGAPEPLDTLDRRPGARRDGERPADEADDINVINYTSAVKLLPLLGNAGAARRAPCRNLPLAHTSTTASPTRWRRAPAPPPSASAAGGTSSGWVADLHLLRPAGRGAHNQAPGPRSALDGPPCARLVVSSSAFLHLATCRRPSVPRSVRTSAQGLRHDRVLRGARAGARARGDMTHRGTVGPPTPQRGGAPRLRGYRVDDEPRPAWRDAREGSTSRTAGFRPSDVDDRGCFGIIDRSKKVLKLAHGEHVSPERLEGAYLLRRSRPRNVRGDADPACLVGVLSVERVPFAAFASTILGRELEPNDDDALRQRRSPRRRSRACPDNIQNFAGAEVQQLREDTGNSPGS
ncbi:AMP-binding enzyme [Cordyceps fumosorosea ARSEF 2679]|uniref:AMP-binding enzyme n=1 Tax=Cordyceps fumosorosea (strain ARSEF 2679) TaxID=1081104 RepID=A0A167PAR9_CORFA|nr:AMP-binding enzyme [Cordyceps fumosorosea ARSEF 2679]OAA56469.1 AMP-binding enzyme [Cordyceps fumosorosea ARSEF 2679]